jgi:hypothetical protein
VGRLSAITVEGGAAQPSPFTANENVWKTPPLKYVEQIEGTQNLAGVVAGAATGIWVDSNYGCIWNLQ